MRGFYQPLKSIAPLMTYRQFQSTHDGVSGAAVTLAESGQLIGIHEGRFTKGPLSGQGVMIPIGTVEQVHNITIHESSGTRGTVVTENQNEEEKRKSPPASVTPASVVHSYN